MEPKRAGELMAGLLETVARRLDFARGLGERALVGLPPERAAVVRKYVDRTRELEAAVAEAIGEIESGC